MRIGFLYNHEALHQISHTAPVIAELAVHEGVEVVVLTSSPAQEERVRALIDAAAARVRFVSLDIGHVAKLLDRAIGFAAPIRRIATLHENLDAFAGLNALVVPETTSLMLRDRFGLQGVAMIWIPHGAGDRSVGFREVARGFDLVLVSGKKIRDRMLAAGLVTADNHAVIGYPKFDTIADAPSPRLFADDRPVVLYNPHFDPLLSSWYAMAPAVLDWFARQRRFNLIAAPHVMLFQRRVHASVEHRRLRWRRDLAARYRDVPGILFDPGSERSIDMTYTRAADIYLGDASSQIYEWIARPRPAIFLDAARAGWQGKAEFAHWQLGEVIDSVADLPAALDRAMVTPDAFRTAQEAAFAATFSHTDITASRRAADAIIAYLGSRKPGFRRQEIGLSP